jgi:adenylate cyclase
VCSVYLEEMSSIIIESDGIVDKYIGDAIMAFWNAPLLVNDHPYIACCSALKSQQHLARLRSGRMSFLFSL